MRVLFFVSLLFQSALAFADGCIPQSEMQAIAQGFPQFAELANSEYCPDGSETAHLIAGLEFMRQTRFQDPMDRSPDQLFSGTFANDWWGYFTGRVNNFEVDNSCPKGVIAYVWAFGGSTMYACAAALTDNFTGLDLASVFMHEARHLDGFPHVTCSRGPRKGLSGACDNEITDTGSYDVTVETYAQIAKYAPDVHPALRAYARNTSIVYADEAFEVPVQISRNQHFLVMTNDTVLHALNLDGYHEQVGVAPETGNVVMRAQNMILLPDNKDSTARYFFAHSEGDIPTQAGALAEEYNGLAPIDRGTFVDAHIGTQWTARLYTTKLRMDCNPNSPGTEELALPETPVSLTYMGGYDRGASSIQMIMQSGKVYDIGCSRNRAFMQDSQFTVDQPYRKIYAMGGLTLGVTMDGNIRSLENGTSQPYAMGAGVDGQVRTIMPYQTFEFFDTF